MYIYGDSLFQFDPRPGRNRSEELAIYDQVNYILVFSRSVLDMLHHLTGKQIPGISPSRSFSKDIDQRVHQLLQQHKAMLAFLR